MVQISRLLYVVLSAVDGRRTLTETAQVVSAEVDRSVSEANIAYLVERKLEPLGLASLRAGVELAVRCGTHRPVLSLSVRRTLLSETMVRRVAAVLQYLFLPLVVYEMVHGWLFLDYWLITHVDGQRAVAAMAATPSLLLVVLILSLLSMAFHELGHAAACRYGGANPGPIGMGIYLIWPALYTNVTDAYRLDRKGRLRTDLGGIYFNVISIIALGVAYLITEWPPLLMAMIVGHLEILQQLLPIVRLDGYFILGDLVGVPDLFGYMKPIMRGLIPGKGTGAKAMALTRRTRVLVRIWVLLTVIALGANLCTLVVRAPSLVGTLVNSCAQQVNALRQATDSWNGGGMFLAGMSLFTLMIPVIGLTITLIRVGRGAGGALKARVSLGKEKDLARHAL